MRLLDLFEALSPRKELVIFPGGFHIFTNGHASVYNFLVKKFQHADVYVASSNDTKKRPFAFEDKKFLASQAGIPENRFVEVKEPYKSIEITRNYDPTHTVLIFALSQKDKDRLGSPIKKNGEPSYLQPYPGSIKECDPFSKHGYYIVAPTIDFSILGKQVNSASQIREWYANASDNVRLKLAKALYPTSHEIPKVKKLLDGVLGNQKITESSSNRPAHSGWLTPREFTLFHRRKMYEAVRKVALSPEAQAFIKKNGSKTTRIDDNGWLFPSGRFVPNGRRSHVQNAEKMGYYNNYDDALEAGLLRVVVRITSAYFETTQKMSPKLESFLVREIKRLPSGLSIILYTSANTGFQQTFEWDGKQFNREKARRW